MENVSLFDPRRLYLADLRERSNLFQFFSIRHTSI